MAATDAGAAFDSWDAIRASSWEVTAGDHLVETLADLYQALGISGLPRRQRLAALREFTAEPAYHPAPVRLKQEVEQALAPG